LFNNFSCLVTFNIFFRDKLKRLGRVTSDVDVAEIEVSSCCLKIPKNSLILGRAQLNLNIR